MTSSRILQLDFLDHCMDGDEPIRCRVFGRVVKDEPLYYQIEAWGLPNNPEIDDTTRFIVLKSTIIAETDLCPCSSSSSSCPSSNGTPTSSPPA